jgi:tRNA pseudouridine synthase 10
MEPQRPDDWNEVVERLCRNVERKVGPVEFTTFLVGTTLPRSMPRERSEPLRLEMNRKISDHVMRTYRGTRIAPQDPDLTIEVDVAQKSVRVRIASIYVYGRYLKENRSLPQTRWHCKKCRGRGCEQCDGKGRVYPTSVEEILAVPLLEQTGAHEGKLHGMGREDVDARMLGGGRPFVLELTRPRTRTLDCTVALGIINESCTEGVSLADLRPAGRRIKKLVKEVEPEKTYLARVRSEGALEEAAMMRLAGVAPLDLEQQTPLRVLHRRADLVRRRRILALTAVPVTARASDAGTSLDLRIRAEAGTYVKEFITGDEGRTRPSLSDILQTSCQCEELDVLEVHFDLDEAMRLRPSLASGTEALPLDPYRTSD